MLSSELTNRAKKLEREQKQRLEKERSRAEKERLLEQRAKERRQRHEDEASRRRAAALAAVELERLQNEEELEFNNGVWWRAELAATPISEEVAASKGIRRGADKVTLPQSAGKLLMAQDAPKNGALFFKLSVQDRNTHVGLLDFTAAEGVIGIPPQVAASLWDGGGVPPEEKLTVTYRRLDKGTFVRFQPRTADFQKEVGDAVEEVLVAALSTRSAISQGDWLRVPFADSIYQLRVQQLRPSLQVSVIDTEMEAEVEPSIETEERLKREAKDAEEQQRFLEHQRAEAEAERTARAYEALQEAARRERIRQEKEAGLPPEPVSEPSTLVMVRFPDGSRHTRRFRHAEPLSLIFQFVDAKGAGGLPPGGFRLVTHFPRRVLEAGPTALQEATEPRSSGASLRGILIVGGVGSEAGVAAAGGHPTCRADAAKLHSFVISALNGSI